MRALPDALVSTLSQHLALSNSRLETMVVIILGLVNGRTVNLSHIASQFAGPARLASNYRRLQRFFQFVRLDEAWLARTLIGLLNLRAPFTPCLDRTNWKVGAKDINLLVLCIFRVGVGNMVLAVQAMRNFIPPLEHLATMLEDAGAPDLSAECSDLAGRLAESEKSLTGEGKEAYPWIDWKDFDSWYTKKFAPD